MQLENRVVLITGAGSGIGRALAIACARAGARLVLAGRQKAALEATASLLGKRYSLVVAVDINLAADRQVLADVIEQNFRRLDVLVNNAGILSVGPHADLSDGEIAAMVSTNLLAPMLLTRSLLPLLRRAESGARIVNVGSVFGDIAYPLFSAYSATKFGLRGFSDAIRRELRPEGIGVTYVAPRATRTGATPKFQALIEPFAMRVDSVEKVARQVVSAIETDARSVYARGMERLFVLVQRLAPRLIDRAIAGHLAQLARSKARQARS